MGSQYYRYPIRYPIIPTPSKSRYHIRNRQTATTTPWHTCSGYLPAGRPIVMLYDTLHGKNVPQKQQKDESEKTIILETVLGSNLKMNYWQPKGKRTRTPPITILRAHH